MRDDLARALARFPDVVLTGRDRTGAPVSVRARPAVDGDRLRLPRAPGVEIADGPASILGHSHDERLWTLRSFVAPGALVARDGERLFTPSGLVPGTGLSGLPRPRIPRERFR